ncbi:hypothetical protein [Nocardioides daeguensis]|uniref:Uncharacterized protein n=1 Tax=Nocardioides daeguensis TaxID=908359 RepID=A0ABP6WH59_9ACTN|nr:hypothetical protein [Nocardioides daeguensis]MBV6729108.1 hypothetical protein [Nocardioides daeguensis]MCR1774888.1 hypothetical protein [Nocardioides daeguensis]
MSLPDPVLRLTHTWSVALQQRARRNAMVALTACTQRRAEREDVEAFLAARAEARAPARRTPDHEGSVSLHA